MFVYFLLAWGRKGGREGGSEGAANNNPTWVRCVDAAMAISHCTLEVCTILASSSEGSEDR